jgi:hypothetical protein
MKTEYHYITYSWVSAYDEKTIVSDQVFKGPMFEWIKMSLEEGYKLLNSLEINQIEFEYLHGRVG